MIDCFVISCNDIPAMDPSGTSDPYIRVCAKDELGTFYLGKTETKKKCLSATFDSDYKFPFRVSILRCRDFVFHLYDANVIQSDEMIGAATINVSSIIYDEAMHLPVSNGKGEITVMFRCTPLPENLLPTAHEGELFYVFFEIVQATHTYNTLEFNFHCFNTLQNLCIPYYELPHTNTDHPGPFGSTVVTKIRVHKKEDHVIIPFIISNGEFTGQVNITVAKASKEKESKGMITIPPKEAAMTIISRQQYVIQQAGFIFPGFGFKVLKQKFEVITFGTPLIAPEPSPAFAEQVLKPLLPHGAKFNYRLWLNTSQPVTLSQMCAFHNIPVPHDVSIGNPPKTVSEFYFYNIDTKLICKYEETDSTPTMPWGTRIKSWGKFFTTGTFSAMFMDQMRLKTNFTVAAPTFLIRDQRSVVFSIYTFGENKIPFELGAFCFKIEDDKVGNFLPYLAHRIEPYDWRFYPIGKDYDSPSITVGSSKLIIELINSMGFNNIMPPEPQSKGCLVQ